VTTTGPHNADNQNADQLYALELEQRHGLESRVAREVILSLFAANTGSAGSYDLVVAERTTGREVGRLDAGSDASTAAGFRDLLRARARDLTPSDFREQYHLGETNMTRTRAPRRARTRPAKPRRILRSILLPACILLAATGVWIVWSMR